MRWSCGRGRSCMGGQDWWNRALPDSKPCFGPWRLLILVSGATAKSGSPIMWLLSFPVEREEHPLFLRSWQQLPREHWIPHSHFCTFVDPALSCLGLECPSLNFQVTSSDPAKQKGGPRDLQRLKLTKICSVRKRRSLPLVYL